MMEYPNQYKQSAGRVSAEAWTDSQPVYVQIAIAEEQYGNFRLTREELHDLRYVVDRMIARLPPERLQGEG